MADSLDLTAEIGPVIDTALERGAPLVVGYVGDDDYPVLSFRGSIHVHGPDQLALWARKQDEGLVQAIATRPKVSAIYLAMDGPPPVLVSIRGLARVEPAADEEVYAAIPEQERGKDPDRKGVAVLIDVESVTGVGAEGPFELHREI